MNEPREGPPRKPLDTSDKLPDETWLQYWDRKADERHGPGCKCAHHYLRTLGIENVHVLNLEKLCSEDKQEQ